VSGKDMALTWVKWKMLSTKKSTSWPLYLCYPLVLA